MIGRAKVMTIFFENTYINVEQISLLANKLVGCS